MLRDNKGMRLPLLKGILLALLLVPSFPLPATESDLPDWYRIDIILFTPREPALDDEAWPTMTPAYPAEMMSIADRGSPRPYRLSQLEQLHASTLAFETERNPRPLQASGTDAPALIEQTSELPDSPDKDSPGEVATSPDPATLAEDKRQIAAGLAFADLGGSSTGSLAGRLGRSSDFNLLAQRSWIQPVGREPVPIMLQAGERYDDLYEIEGTLSFSRSHHLHVRAQLWYTQFEARGQAPEPLAPALPKKVLDANRDLLAVENRRGRFAPAARYAMRQSRPMRSNELHYLDHPLFGVMVTIKAYRPEEE